MKYFDLLKWSIFSPNDGFESGSFPCARGGGGEDNWCGSCIVFDMITNSTTITHLYANPDQAGPDVCGCDAWLPLNSPIIDNNDIDISKKKQNDPNVNSNEILCTLAQVGNFWPTFIFGSENNILVEYEFNNIYRHNPFSGVSDVWSTQSVDICLDQACFSCGRMKMAPKLAWSICTQCSNIIQLQLHIPDERLRTFSSLLKHMVSMQLLHIRYWCDTFSSPKIEENIKQYTYALRHLNV